MKWQLKRLLLFLQQRRQLKREGESENTAPQNKADAIKRLVITADQFTFKVLILYRQRYGTEISSLQIINK